MASGSGTVSQQPSTTVYIATAPADLESWAENDENKVLLIEKEHVKGREEQAIKFAEYLNTFKDIPQRKFKRVRDFYEHLQQNITAGKDYDNLLENPDEGEGGDVTGFSASSCKRLRQEGNCYILLQQKGYNDFPQSQSAAITLLTNTTDDTILDVWKTALELCGGNKKRVFKSDICTAVARYNANKPSVQVQLDETKKQLEEKQKELDAAKKDMKKQIAQVRKETVIHLQQKQELLDQFCLAYEDREWTKPIYTLEELKSILPETCEETEAGADGLVYIKDLLGFVGCNSMEEWEANFYHYGIFFATKRAVLVKDKGKGKGKGKA